MSSRRESLQAEQQREIARHNGLYREHRPVKLMMDADDWTKFDRIRVPLNAYHAAVLRLGDVRRIRVLDLGCGDGWFSVILAKRGAEVTGFDLSVEAVRTASERGKTNGVAERTRFAVASVYDLPFRDGAFDIVTGMAILHHVSDKRRTATELSRVLAPKGRAVFMEPLGDSLTLERLRRMVPVASEAEDDPNQWATQFKLAELQPFRDEFEVRSEVFHLLSRLDRLTKLKWLHPLLGQVDRGLLKFIPPLRRFARSIVVDLRKLPA